MKLGLSVYLLNGTTALKSMQTGNKLKKLEQQLAALYISYSLYLQGEGQVKYIL